MKLAYSIKEAAELLGCGLNRAYEMVHSNTLPHFKFGKKIMIPAKSISDLVDQQIEEQLDANISTNTK
ncbi:helix-turn-helix domain-containing protein [Gammaproteobacteria bacterium]|nr:helix-turn-helix domain-containing protein [Gammaproteobacteria bacterium]